MNKRKIGNTYEQMAAEYLQNAGVKIVEKNYRNRQGEIDLIGFDGECLVFFEVKYRKNASKGAPVEAVTPRHSHGDPTSLAPHERLTDLAVVPRE